MKKVLFLAIILLAANCAFADPRIKGIKIAVENPTGESRPATDVVIQLADLRKIAPEFTPGAVIVTTSDASTLEEDATALVTTELPSQVDAIEREGKGDELAFQIDLKPRQTRIVTIHYGEVDRIWRLRSDYPRRTNALFSRKIEGLGWESDRNAFRIYFDKRNAIDMYGKRRPSMQLLMFASPDYIYHDESPEGRDTYRIGAAIGIGAVAAMVDGKIEKVADVKDRQWRVISTGPVRSILELTYAGWNVAGQSVTLHSRITVWAGEYGFTHAVTADTPVPGALITGLPLKDGVPVFKSEPGPATPIAWLATWGEQVVNPGAAESGAVPGSNIGLAVILPSSSAARLGQDALNHVVQLNLHGGKAAWYVMAAWDQNESNRLIATNMRGDMAGPSSIVLPPDGIYTRDAFLAKVKDQVARMATPVRITILSTTATPQLAPADTLGAHPTKSYTQAIDLMRLEIDRTAAKWESIPSASPTISVAVNKGPGFFTEGSNSTGEWKQHEGYSWTGSFWTGELWQMFSRTRDEKYRRWAELWGSRMAGHEMTQTHDVGFLYFYSAAMGYDRTKQPPLRESVLRAAARLEQLYNPVTHLLSRWEPKGDETIIDTMMNLQVLWWASRETQDPKWLEIGLSHALRSAEWLIRPDGSVIQSAHYNPGDNRQEFDLDGGHSSSRPQLLKLPNQAAPGELVFTHTHQGYAAHTAWARGTGWALYGFTVAFAETHDPRLRATAERIADFALDNLPEDGVPWYDLEDEGVHFRNRDSSAAAIIAGGLLRLSELSEDKARTQRYRQEGERIIQSLINRYLTPVNTQDHTPPGVLRHGTSTRPNDGILIYGQYYLLEDLLWLEQHGAKRAAADSN
jgi:hypothetical protein